MKAVRAGEFTILYVLFPVVFALALPPDAIWLVLLPLTAVTLILLARTSGFDWRHLRVGGLAGQLPVILGFSAAALVVSLAVTLLLRPEALFWLPRNDPKLWLLVMVLYPLLSVLPQELAWRVLFFTRYGGLFPNRRLAYAVNGACFALAHLFLWNAPALLLSGLGGIAFAMAYHGRGSFALACILHMLAGQILFTVGAGVFFYHGAVG